MATRSTSGRYAGRSRLREAEGADPRLHPALRFNYLSTDQDRREWVEGIGSTRNILTQPAFGLQRWRTLTRSERRDRRGDPRLGREGRRDCPAPRAPHAWASTRCRCSTPSMKVHGLEGLRVVDASSMPYVTNGNIYAPVMMLAEKSALDLILGNTPSSRRKSASTATGPAGMESSRRPPWPAIPPRVAHRDGPGAKHAVVRASARCTQGRRPVGRGWVRSVMRSDGGG